MPSPPAPSLLNVLSGVGLRHHHRWPSCHHCSRARPSPIQTITGIPQLRKFQELVSQFLPRGISSIPVPCEAAFFPSRLAAELPGCCSGLAPAPISIFWARPSWDGLRASPIFWCLLLLMPLPSGTAQNIHIRLPPRPSSWFPVFDLQLNTIPILLSGRRSVHAAWEVPGCLTVVAIVFSL